MCTSINPLIRPVSSEAYVTRLKSRFLQVEIKNPFCRAQSCYNLVKTRGQYYFSIQSYGILKTAKTSNLKAHNNEKIAIKEKEPYFNII